LLAPELQRQLLHLWNTQREQDVGLVRLWETRHLGEEVSALREVISTVKGDLGRLSRLPAMVQQQSAGMVQLLAWRDHRAALDMKLERTLELIDGRVDVVEKGHLQLDNAVKVQARDIASLAAQTTKGFDETQKNLADLNLRVRSLEEDRIKYKAKAATVATIASMLVALVAWLIGRFAK
jgi:hypothetical protein